MSDSAPTALQAIKLLAVYLSSPGSRVRRGLLRPRACPPSAPAPWRRAHRRLRAPQESVLESLATLLADTSVANNPTLLLMAANVQALAGNLPEALKLCHAVQNLELCAPAAPRGTSAARRTVAASTLRRMRTAACLAPGRAAAPRALRHVVSGAQALTRSGASLSRRGR